MLETHPFKSFVPKGARFLILGSFVGREETYKQKWSHRDAWFYGSKRNQFWQIIETVYDAKLETKKEKQKLFSLLKIAITDVIQKCERKIDNNLDMNLINIVYNTKGIEYILAHNKIHKILFSSRFVENRFKRHFKNIVDKYPSIKLITLPSPSPRYASLTKANKINTYKHLLPKLK